MSRRNAAVKRPVLPDPQFNSRLASMMISRLMKHGKKSTVRRRRLQKDVENSREKRNIHLPHSKPMLKQK